MDNKIFFPDEKSEIVESVKIDIVAASNVGSTAMDKIRDAFTDTISGVKVGHKEPFQMAA